ncbi:MAG: VOC family protein [Nocardioidaceae bacterium]
MSDAGPPAAFKDLCMDASDAGRLGQFWAAVLGLELHLHDDGDACLRGPTPQHTVWVDTVPEPKSVKHRIHLRRAWLVGRRPGRARRDGAR